MRKLIIRVYPSEDYKPDFNNLQHKVKEIAQAMGWEIEIQNEREQTITSKDFNSLRKAKPDTCPECFTPLVVEWERSEIPGQSREMAHCQGCGYLESN